MGSADVVREAEGHHVLRSYEGHLHQVHGLHKQGTEETQPSLREPYDPVRVL